MVSSTFFAANEKGETEKNAEKTKQIYDYVMREIGVTMLSEEERKELEGMLKIINSTNESEHIKFSEKVLGNLSEDKVFKFCAKSKVFKDFCVREELPHTKKWAHVLNNAEKKYSPGKTFSSINKIPHSTFNQYRALYCYSLARDKEDEALAENDPKKLIIADLLLRLAIRLGCSKALTYRLSQNQLKLKGEKPFWFHETAKEAIIQLRDDVVLAGTLYWTTGFFLGAGALLDVGNYYENEHRKDPDHPPGTYYQELGIELFLLGYHLAKYSPLSENTNLMMSLHGTTEAINIAKFYFPEQLAGCKTLDSAKDLLVGDHTKATSHLDLLAGAQAEVYNIVRAQRDKDDNRYSWSLTK